MSKKSKVRNHLKALSLPQLRALAIQRNVAAGSVVLTASKETLVSLMTDVPNILRPVAAPSSAG